MHRISIYLCRAISNAGVWSHITKFVIIIISVPACWIEVGTVSVRIAGAAVDLAHFDWRGRRNCWKLGLSRLVLSGHRVQCRSVCSLVVGLLWWCIAGEARLWLVHGRP